MPSGFCSVRLGVSHKLREKRHSWVAIMVSLIDRYQTGACRWSTNVARKVTEVLDLLQADLERDVLRYVTGDTNPVDVFNILSKLAQVSPPTRKRQKNNTWR